MFQFFYFFFCNLLSILVEILFSPHPPLLKRNPHKYPYKPPSTPPKLTPFPPNKQGYTYSVFNLVYETNLASCRIWDALGFKRIGRVKACGNLRSHPDELVDAIIYGRDLGPEGEDFVSEERFDKIRFYLKHGKYPNGADRAEKSRLRSAATHYKLVPVEAGGGGGGGGAGGGGGEERLMLKDKEVVSDPQRQYEIARQKHAEQHGGINKTTAAIAEMYHWVRIKETVSMAIKNCPECKDATKIPTVRPVVSDGLSPSPGDGHGHHHHHNQQQQQSHNNHGMAQHHHHQDPNALIERLVNFDDHHDHHAPSAYNPSLPSHPHPHPHPHNHNLSPHHNLYHPSSPNPVASMQALQNQLQGQLQQELHGYSSANANTTNNTNTSSSSAHGLPLDPQIMAAHQDHHHGHEYQLHDHEQQRKYGEHIDAYQHHDHHHHHGAGGAPGEDGHYELDMSDLQDAGAGDGHVLDMEDGVGAGMGGVGAGGGLGGVGAGGGIGGVGVGSGVEPPNDDTRLATARHVTHHDQPMAFVHEGHEEDRQGKEEEDDLFGGD